MPLGEAQARASASPPSRVSRETPEESQAPHSAAPVIDMDFEDVPEQSYEEFAFRLPRTPDVVYVLGIEDDTVLFDIMAYTKEGSPNEIIEYFFEETFRRAVYADDGAEVDNGFRMLFEAIDPRPKEGKPVSRKYLMSVVLTAVDHWSEELTDTSMRPNRRHRRRRR